MTKAEMCEIATPKTAEMCETQPEQMAVIAQVVQNVVAPVFKTLADMVSQNAQALERFAALQAQQNARMEQLERQMRLNTPATTQQVRYLNGAVRDRAKVLLWDKGVEDGAAAKKLGRAIRKSVLMRYGVSAMNEIPKCEYGVCMDLIANWLDVRMVREIINEVKA